MGFDYRLRGTVQVACASVVAQPAPVRHHLIHRSAGEAGKVREALKKAGIVGDDGVDLSLLQHDLRQPDAVRVVRVLPRQRMAPVLLLPVDQAFGEITHVTVFPLLSSLIQGACPRRVGPGRP